MSTPAAADPVKQALLEKLHAEVLPALEALVAALPPALADAAQAERQIRAGALAAARTLLDAWGQTADPTATRPACPHARLPMRHKAHKAGTPLPTLAAV